jgi:hypothetical protein
MKTDELLNGFYEFPIDDRFSEIGKLILIMLTDFLEAFIFVCNICVEQ